jgi:hypothetical protein
MASHPKATDLPALLAKLCDAGIEFIIVGGAACVIQGAPITTNDLDIVHRRTPENIERLLELLLQLDATMRYDFANRGLRPTAELLAGKGHLNLSTSLGPIDPLCELDGLGFDDPVNEKRHVIAAVHREHTEPDLAQLVARGRVSRRRAVDRCPLLVPQRRVGLLGVVIENRPGHRHLVI